MPTTTEALIAALSEAPAVVQSKNKLEIHYAEHPEVLEAIRVARRDKRLSYTRIAELIAEFDPDAAIASSTLNAWLRKQGIN